MSTKTQIQKINQSREEILEDFRIVTLSRQASIQGRKEVFMGKAKFGLFGDGKELPQIAMAKVFRKGDFRSGYYRDQTFMMAIGELSMDHFFAQLYANPDENHEPCNAGRLMNAHYGTRLLDKQGNWKNQLEMKNSSGDISPTAGQMPRLLGLAYASKIYRNVPELANNGIFSNNGNEIAFGTIGDASTSEGPFYETINAAGVLQVPMLISVWDDGYGISVPVHLQTTKGDISKVLSGFQRTENEPGYEIYKVNGWDYQALCDAYQDAALLCRGAHVPVMVHVNELTQPQGHSTSGSHERYKSKERLDWERKYDCLKQFREWILVNQIATEQELQDIETTTKNEVVVAKDKAWALYQSSIKTKVDQTINLLDDLAKSSRYEQDIFQIKTELEKKGIPIYSDIVVALKKTLRTIRFENIPEKRDVQDFLNQSLEENRDRFNSYLNSESSESPLKVEIIDPIYTKDSPLVDGREVLRACFDANLSRDNRIIAFGEDLGKIGDVNQGFAGLQQKYGELRVSDTGIRECTIVGQGLGAALRGLRPIAEIQYLDYILYAIQILSDDLATLHHRTKGGQKAPLIIRTRGHRLEGMWHAGSPMGVLVNALRGMYIVVPRDMTQAAGFYNTLLRGDNPAVIIECLNGYRLKEKIPENVGEFTIPLGVPEILCKGDDITIVTYGSMCRYVFEAAQELKKIGITCEVLDVQTLLPFDINHAVVKSIKKTNRVIFADEDYTGGGTAYMMQMVLEGQNAYQYLDSPPRTLAAKSHRPCFASDGDYFSKPGVDDVYDLVYEIFNEQNPTKYPLYYK